MKSAQRPRQVRGWNNFYETFSGPIIERHYRADFEILVQKGQDCHEVAQRCLLYHAIRAWRDDANCPAVHTNDWAWESVLARVRGDSTLFAESEPKLGAFNKTDCSLSTPDLCKHQSKFISQDGGRFDRTAAELAFRFRARTLPPKDN